MSRNAKNAPGAWGRRAFEDERIPLVTDSDAQTLLGERDGTVVPGKAQRERLRLCNRIGVACLVLGTLGALGFAVFGRGYGTSLSGHDSHDPALAKQKSTPFPLLAHEIWLGDEMPAVKRALFERNRDVLSPAGWELRLWGVGDVTVGNFPHTYNALRRGLAHHDKTGENTFSMVGDLMKFEILFTHGGLYLDTNVELLKDPSPLFWDTFKSQKQAFFVSDPGDNRFVSAGMIGAIAPGSKLLREVVTNKKYVANVDFGKHCVANAVTGPVMLTAHLENNHGLLDTVQIFEREVAYPLACGENYLDPCVVKITEGGVGEDVDKEVTDTEERETVAARAAAVARSMSGIRTSALGSDSEKMKEGVDVAKMKSNAPPPPNAVGVLQRAARTVSDVAASARRWRAADATRAAKTARLPSDSHPEPVSRIVTEQDGSVWNTTVPCVAVASHYPGSFAIDHFSAGGASWQQNCDRVEKARAMTDWVETETSPGTRGKLVHDWAMSAVRYLGGPTHGQSLVKRIRMHATQGVPGRARLVVVASSLRAGGALLNEMLETTADHPVSSKIWYRENEARADAFFVTYVTLGDLWSHGAFVDVTPGSWQDRLRLYLRNCGVSGKSIDEAHVDPVAFMNETLAKLWENGIDTVHVMLTQSGLGLKAKHEEASGESSGEASGEKDTENAGQTSSKPGSESENVLQALLAAFPDAPTVCLRRRNVLDAYVSLYRAEHGDKPWQIVAEPPPAPEVGAAQNLIGNAGAWGFGIDGKNDGNASLFAPGHAFTDGKDGKASFEAFGAFGGETHINTNHKVFFDARVFAWLGEFENDWLVSVAAITKNFPSGNGAKPSGCYKLVYEDDLVDDKKQLETLRVLNTKYGLNLNLEALPLQKLRRVNAAPAKLSDFENPDALDTRALAFLAENG